METDPYVILSGLSFYFLSPSTNADAMEEHYFNI